MSSLRCLLRSILYFIGLIIAGELWILTCKENNFCSNTICSKTILVVLSFSIIRPWNFNIVQFNLNTVYDIIHVLGNTPLANKILLNVFHKKMIVFMIILVLCILRVNLTDADLFEFIQWVSPSTRTSSYILLHFSLVFLMVSYLNAVSYSLNNIFATHSLPI